VVGPDSSVLACREGSISGQDLQVQLEFIFDQVSEHDDNDASDSDRGRLVPA